MNIFETFNHSPKNVNAYYSPTNLNKQGVSYQQYFEAKLKEKVSQRRKKSSTSKNKKNVKSKSKLRKIKDQASVKSPKHKKRAKQQFKIDPMYASRISQILSEISIPSQQAKVTKKKLRQLQSKIMTQILSLREQKILALENLNKITDKKNKTIEMIKGLQVLKQTSRLNTQDDEQSDEQQIDIKFSKYQNQSSRKKYQFDSKVLKRSLGPQQTLNQKIQRERLQLSKALNQAGKIRQQLMRPLIEHPLLQRNRQLKVQFEQLTHQLQQSNIGRSHIVRQISSFKEQNQKLLKQLQKQKSKLAGIQSKRFETFFPKDKIRMDQMTKLSQLHDKLNERKCQLEESLMNGTIIRRAQDQILLQQLRQENRYLHQNCEKLTQIKQGNSLDQEYYDMSIEQLQNLVHKQLQNKKILSELIQQFRYKILDMQRQNSQLKRRQPRVSYYY